MRGSTSKQAPQPAPMRFYTGAEVDAAFKEGYERGLVDGYEKGCKESAKALALSRQVQPRTSRSTAMPVTIQERTLSVTSLPGRLTTASQDINIPGASRGTLPALQGHGSDRAGTKTTPWNQRGRLSRFSNLSKRQQTSARPVKCPLCDNTFKNTADLWSHHKENHSEAQSLSTLRSIIDPKKS